MCSTPPQVCCYFLGGQGTHPDPPESLPLTKKWAFWEQKVVLRPDCIDSHLDQLDQSMQWGLKTSLLSPSPPHLPRRPQCAEGRCQTLGPGKMGGIKTKALQLGLLGSNPTPSVSGYGAGASVSPSVRENK